MTPDISIGAIEDRLEETIPALMDRWHVPGLSIALVHDGAVAGQRCFGLKRAGAAAPVEPDTIFQAASLSKPVFAYAMLKMAERGDIALDAPLTAYLPDPYVPDDPLLDRITARRVLSHTTGWPNWRPEGQPLQRERAPGERFGYSGEGYVYLQHVVERVTGQPLDNYMKANLLDPLGMTDSSYAWADADDLAVASSHDQTGKPCERFSGIQPEAASSLHTTSHDFGRFLAAVMTSGREPWRLYRESIAEMLRPQVRLNDWVSWGLGWGLEDTRNGRAIWHWGDNPGYKSFALVAPDVGRGLVVMTNGDGGMATWEPIVRLAFGDDHPAFAWLASFYGATALTEVVT